jgi:phage-related protein
MAGSARRVVVEFLGEDKSLGKTMGDVDSKSGKLVGALGKVAKVAGVALAAGAVAGGVALFKMTQGAIEDEAAQKKLEKQLQNSAGATDKQVASVENWITAQGKALGVTDDELRPALSKLVTATKDVGEAQDLASLAMDAAAGTGKSLEGVSLALMKARNGDIAGLSRLGIATKNAAGETMTFEQVTKNMAETFGGQAATQANTLDGKMARLKLILSETGETIGSKLIPVVTTMADWFLNKGVPALAAFGGWIQTNVLPALQRIGEWISTRVVPALRQMGEWISTHVLPIFQRLGSEGPSIFAKIRTAVENNIQTIARIAQIVAGRLAPVFEQLVATFRSRVLPTMMLILDRFIEWQPTISRVVTKVVELGASILGKVLPPIIRFAGFLISTMVPVVLDTIEVLAKIIGKVIAVGGAFVDGVQDVAKWVSGVREKIAAALQVVGGIPGKAKDALAGIGSALLAAGQALIQGLIDGITSKVAALRDKLSSVTKLIPDWKGPLDKDRILLTPAGVALMEGLIKGIDKGKKKLQGVLEKITDYIKGKQDKLADLLGKRQSIIDSFKGFSSSIFGADMGFEASAARRTRIGDLQAKVQERRSAGATEGDREIVEALHEIAQLQKEEAGTPTGLGALLAFQSDARRKAEQLAASVQTLINKGLSTDLLRQLQGAGESGQEQINMLATASAEQIAQANADNHATQLALQQAGLAASAAQGVEAAIAQAERDLKLADGIRDKLAELLKQQDKNTIVQLNIDGKVLHVSLLKLKRESGRRLNLD